MENVKCSLCNKKKPHGHKGCNEVGTLRVQIGEPKPKEDSEKSRKTKR